MIKELYENICRDEDMRANLAALKKEIKSENGKRAFAYLLAGDYSGIGELLRHKDAKVRKNAALILGEMECEDMLPVLWQGYQAEQQFFVRPSYVKAMASYDCRPYLQELQKRRDFLMENLVSEETEKHVREELAGLRVLLAGYEREEGHVFTGVMRETDVILLTNRAYREITREQLKEEHTALFAGGVRVRTQDVEGLFHIRTWTEMLFPIRGAALLSENPSEAADVLAKSGLLPFLESCHKGEGTFYFRAEVRGNMERNEKTAFIKKFSQAFEKASGRKFMNSVSDYEMELRILQRKDGGFLPLLKLYTLKDKRFSYRKQVLSASIHPANAALVTALLKPYLKEGAQVLDPFCGVGTMLIERARVLKAGYMYGVDIYANAIEKARVNAEAAEVDINFITRDFFDFHHKYLFDEIITNMPTVTGTKSKGEIMELYERFLHKAPGMLAVGGIMAIYTTEEGILQRCLKKCDFIKLLKRWTVREKEGSVLYVLQLENER